jgi:hypothetical protein
MACRIAASLRYLHKVLKQGVDILFHVSDVHAHASLCMRCQAWPAQTTVVCQRAVAMSWSAQTVYMTFNQCIALGNAVLVRILLQV